jgi:hypothetical protein
LPIYCPAGSISLLLLGPDLFARNLVSISRIVITDAFRSACEKQHTRFESRCEPARAGRALTAIRESEIMVATVTTPMITPILLCARSLGEPDTGILHAGISKGATGQRAVQSKWRGR